MRKGLLAVMGTVLFLVGATSAKAAPGPDITGTWVLNLVVDGAPPCECIEIVTFHSGGRLEGPANDHFTGDARGVWSKSGSSRVLFRVVQNNINADGSAGGMYDIGCRFAFAGPDAGTGHCDGSLVSNSGAVVGAFSATFRATRVRVEP